LASSFGIILLAVIAIGIGSVVFHPESSRGAYVAIGCPVTDLACSESHMYLATLTRGIQRVKRK